MFVRSADLALARIRGYGMASAGPELEELVKEFGRLVSFPTAAEITTVSVRTLKRLSQTGELPVYRVGRTKVMRVKTVDLYRLIQRI